MIPSVAIKIIVAVVFLAFYLIKKAAKGNTAPTKFQQPPQNTSNPFQQNPNTNQNPFQQNPAVNQNPFQQSPPPIQNPFLQQPDAFSQPSTRNTTSNMGVGSQSFYCRFCGKKFSSVENLQRDTCFKHPNSDQGLQKHVLYQGVGRPNVGF
jgi:hypothetical protein